MRDDELRLDAEGRFKDSEDLPSTVSIRSSVPSLSPNPESQDLIAQESLSSTMVNLESSKPERVCEVCGGPRGTNKRFCSTRCKAKALSGRNHPSYNPEIHEKRTCEICGEALTDRQLTRGNRVCSGKCQGKLTSMTQTGKQTGEDNPSWTGGPIEMFCEVCGEVYEVKRSHAKNSKYCSNECRIIGYRKGEWILCRYCANPFWTSPGSHKKFYCSRHCFALHKRTSQRYIVQCENCGKEFEKPEHWMTERHYCSKSCRYEYCRLENHPNWRGGTSFLPYSIQFTHTLREMIRDRDNRECQYCGLSETDNVKRLEVHHINYDKNDSREENLISLCKSCHTKSGYRRFFWEAYFKMKIQEKDSIQSRLHPIQQEVKE